MRKALAVFLTMAVLLGLSGCGKLLESQYSSSGAHHIQSQGGPSDADMTLEAADYAQLYDAVTAFLNGGVEHGIVRVASYDGDMEADLAQAVTTAANTTPLGAYCAYYINYSIVRLVSVYEAHVSIIYRHTPEEVRDAVRCDDTQALRELMLKALLDRTGTVTIYTSSEELDAQAVTEAVELAYYGNPGDILYIPACTVNAYPETGPERILEIELAFQYAASTVEIRREALLQRAQEVETLAQGETVQDKLLSLVNYFSENVTFDTAVNTSDVQARRYNAMTAYGALVQRIAVGEGYAMAMKVLCDDLGIECAVIRGRLNNINHTWNLVRLDNGELYHLDCSGYDGVMAFRNDEEQIYYNYSWDASQYPACAGESLYGPEYGPPVTNEPTDEPTDEPTEPPTEEPTEEPTDEPTEEPTEGPTDGPAGPETTDPTDTEPPTENG